MISTSLLHLSDLHYESPDSNYSDDVKVNTAPVVRVSVFRNLHRLLQLFACQRSFGAIAITGDITTRGSVDGFDSFLAKTFPFLSGLVSDPRAICMVPGNHDVIWNLAGSTGDYFDQKFHQYRRCVDRVGATTSVIPTGPIPDHADADLQFVKKVRGPLFIDRTRKLAILCINSSFRCGEVNSDLRSALRTPIENACQVIRKTRADFKNTKGLVKQLDAVNDSLTNLLPVIDRNSVFDIPHVTHAQLDYLRGLINEHSSKMKTEWQKYLKIALLHHHLVPFAYQMPEYKAFEVTADAAAVLEMLGSCGFQVILTGHKHQPYCQKVQFAETEILVLGGMTVGGYPVQGFAQGIRHLQLDQDTDGITIHISDLPCNWRGDMHGKVRELIRKAHVERLKIAKGATS